MSQKEEEKMSTKDGKLYGFGKNYFGQLGIGDSENKLKPTKISFFDSKTVKKVCCGLESSIFLLDDNSVYMCGFDYTNYRDSMTAFFTKMLLKLSKKKINRKFPEIIPKFVIHDGDEVVDIFVGSYHTVFLTKFMEVYSGGSNEWGQLGLGDSEYRAKATNIVIPEKVISVTCGDLQTFFISINGNIFATGTNKEGQIGSSFINSTYLTPVKIPFFNEKKVLQIACGWKHSIFICSDNKVYVTGENKYGELGIGNREKQITPPVLLSSLKNEKIISLKCGGYHTLFLSEKKMFLAGGNGNGQLGNGNLNNVYLPFLFSIKNKKITQSLLLSRSTIHFTKKEVFGCGDNEDGELFNGEYARKNSEVMKICDLKVKNQHKDEQMVKIKMERFEYLVFLHEHTDIEFRKKLHRCSQI